MRKYKNENGDTVIFLNTAQGVISLEPDPAPVEEHGKVKFVNGGGSIIDKNGDDLGGPQKGSIWNVDRIDFSQSDGRFIFYLSNEMGHTTDAYDTEIAIVK